MPSSAYLDLDEELGVRIFGTGAPPIGGVLLLLCPIMGTNVRVQRGRAAGRTEILVCPPRARSRPGFLVWSITQHADAETL